MKKIEENSFTPLSNELSKLTLQWLKWQCQLISDVKLGAVFMAKNSHEIESVAHWPDTKLQIPPRLQEIAFDMLNGADTFICKDQCFMENETLVCEVFSLPIKNKLHVIGSVSLMLSVRSEEQKKAVLQLLQWGTIWLEKLLSSALDELYKADAIFTEGASILLRDEPAELSANRICNAVKRRFQCERVAFGLVKGLQVKLVGLSEQLKFDKNSTLARSIELTMEETADQNVKVIFPNDESGEWITHQHKELSQLAKDANILSIPIKLKEHVIGVLVIQRGASLVFDSHEIEILEHFANLLSLPFSKKCTKNGFSQAHLKSSPFKFVSAVFGRDYLKLKLTMLFLVIAMLVLSLVQTDQKVYAKSEVVGSVQYLIVAPQEGYIKSAKVRAGDNVKKDDIILELDNKDLLLEKQRLQSELSKASRSYQHALAMQERAKVGIALAEKAQVQARLDLVNERLKRAVVNSPIDGLIVSGDLSQKLGAPIEKGQLLFELAPLDNYRVILKVDEHDFAKVAKEQLGSLRLAGLPYDPLKVALTRITSQSETQDGRNYFLVEADITKKNNGENVVIKPGMQGVTQITVGRASILWEWMHSTLDRLRLWIWTLGL